MEVRSVTAGFSSDSAGSLSSDCLGVADCGLGSFSVSVTVPIQRNYNTIKKSQQKHNKRSIGPVCSAGLSSIDK